MAPLTFDILLSLLRPIARFCVRRSIKLQDIVEALKIALLEAATEEAELRGAGLNNSRLSLMTGVHRKDVLRISEEGHAPRTERDILSRVIGLWRGHPKFAMNGRPRKLSTEDASNEFAELVRSVSTDVNPAAVLFELERTGAVNRRQSHVTLQSFAYVPKGEASKGLAILADDMADLIESVEINLFQNPSVPQLHIRTAYDNIVEDSVPQISKWVLQKGSAFQREVNSYLGAFDADTNPSVAGLPAGGRIAVGVFGLVLNSSKKP